MAKVLYFGRLPDLIGRSEEDFFLPKTVNTVADLLNYLRQRGEKWEKGLKEEMVTITVNKEFKDPDAAISDADEIAIVSKGLGR